MHEDGQHDTDHNDTDPSTNHLHHARKPNEGPTVCVLVTSFLPGSTVFGYFPVGVLEPPIDR